MPGQEWMFDQRGAFCWNAHSNYSSIKDPSALNNTVGFCIDAGDLGAISFLTRGTAATKAATGLTMASAKGFDFYMFCPPNNDGFLADCRNKYRRNIRCSYFKFACGYNRLQQEYWLNAAVAVVTSIQLGINRIYIETDY
jgi:hypothetical protein